MCQQRALISFAFFLDASSIEYFIVCYVQIFGSILFFCCCFWNNDSFRLHTKHTQSYCTHSTCHFILYYKMWKVQNIYFFHHFQSVRFLFEDFVCLSFGMQSHDHLVWIYLVIEVDFLSLEAMHCSVPSKCMCKTRFRLPNIIQTDAGNSMYYTRREHFSQWKEFTHPAIHLYVANRNRHKIHVWREQWTMHNDSIRFLW